MVEITSTDIDVTAVLRSVESPLAGAVVLVLGRTREVTGDRRTLWLDYECYGAMARAQLARLEADARRRWPIIGCTIVHRVGRVDIGEASVAVAVSSPHRGQSFEAAQWLLDTLKQVAAIWKQEHWSDGTSQWVHPGMPQVGRESKSP
jgi:molybdopterin synthase catalytic subunit